MNMNIEKLMETKEGVQLTSAILITTRLETLTQQIYKRKRRIERMKEYQAEGIDNATERIKENELKIQELNEEVQKLANELLALYK